MHYVLRNMPSFLHACVLSDATFENLLTENDEMPFRSGGDRKAHSENKEGEA